MDTPKAVELIMVIFSRMNKEERQALMRLLRPMRRQLDIKYPNGMLANAAPPDPISKTSLILPGRAQ